MFVPICEVIWCSKKWLAVMVTVPEGSRLPYLQVEPVSYKEYASPQTNQQEISLAMNNVRSERVVLRLPLRGLNSFNSDEAWQSPKPDEGSVTSQCYRILCMNKVLLRGRPHAWCQGGRFARSDGVISTAASHSIAPIATRLLYRP